MQNLLSNLSRRILLLLHRILYKSGLYIFCCMAIIGNIHRYGMACDKSFIMSFKRNNYMTFDIFYCLWRPILSVWILSFLNQILLFMRKLKLVFNECKYKLHLCKSHSCRILLLIHSNNQWAALVKLLTYDKTVHKPLI